MDRATIDAAKANLTEGYGRAAQIVRDRDAALRATYDQLAAQLTSHAAERTKKSGEIAGQQTAGMNTAAQALGLNMPPSPAHRGLAQDFNARDQARYGGDAEGWKSYLGKTEEIASGRNRAAADAFDYMGRKTNEDLESAFLMSLSRGGGGGGGGGRGRGGGGQAEELQQFPNSVPQMTPGAARGLAATRLRLEKQAAVMPKDYKYSVSKNANKKLRKAELEQNRR